MVDERLPEQFRLLILAQGDQRLLGEAGAQYHQWHAGLRRLPHLVHDLRVEVIVAFLLVHLTRAGRTYARHLLHAELAGDGDDRFIVVESDVHELGPARVLHRAAHPLQLERRPFGLADRDDITLGQVERVVRTDVLRPLLYHAQYAQPRFGLVELDLLGANAEHHALLLGPLGPYLVGLRLLPTEGDRDYHVPLVDDVVQMPKIVERLDHHLDLAGTTILVEDAHDLYDAVSIY